MQALSCRRRTARRYVALVTAGCLCPAQSPHTIAPQDIIIFIVGGATYEEARAVAQLNEANKTQKVYLTASAMLNSTSFIGDLQSATKAAR
jgi:hypothetical protein